MFIDYLALDLVNLVIALVLVAVFFVFYVEKDQQKVGPGLLATGSIASISGLEMIFAWPLHGSYNIAFGEPMVLFGVLLFFTGLAVIKGWDLLTLGIFSVFAGLVAIVVGIRMMNLKMTSAPTLAGLAYILTGVGGMLAFPAYLLRKNMVPRIVVAALLIVAAVLFALTGYGSYWGHLASFAKWAPK